MLAEGIFHAHPHPGNQLVSPGAEGPILTLLDLGMVGQLMSRH